VGDVLTAGYLQAELKRGLVARELTGFLWAALQPVAAAA
jgi:hypothetical protein